MNSNFRTQNLKNDFFFRHQSAVINGRVKGSRSTFPSRVNLSGPSLYCIAWSLVNEADTQQDNKVDAVRLYPKWDQGLKYI